MADPQPMYYQIYQNLLKAIHQQKYPVGARLPTEQELCQQYGVSRITSKRALDMLAQEGLISRAKGRGSIVIEGKAALPAATPGQGDSPLLGLVMPDFSETFGVQMIYGFEQACAQASCSFVLKRSCGDLAVERKSVSDLLDLGVQGLAVMPLHGEYYNESILKLIIEGFPVVIIDRRYPGINGSFVGTDNAEGAAQATEHLLNLGHRTIAWVSPQLVHTSTLEDRVKGFTDTMVRHGLPVGRRLWYTGLQSTLPLRNTPEMIRQDIENLTRHLRENPEITAVFAAEYNIAILVEQAAQALNLRIPEDLSLICFDAPTSFHTQNPLTHILQEEKQMGREAAELLLQMVRGGDGDYIRKVTLPGRLVAGKSTGAPPLRMREAGR